MLTLKVVDFTFSAVGDLMVGPTGTSATEAFLVAGFNGFAADVAFSCGNLPPNASCSFTPPVAHLTANIPSLNISFKLTTNQTPGGVYPVTIIASTPGASDLTRTINLTVPDYTLAVANPLITVFPGGGGTFNATLTSLGTFSGSITMICGTGDATVQCSPSSSPIALASMPQNFSFTFTTTSATPPKDYVANIQASDGQGLDHAIAVTIRVVDIALGAPSSSTIDVVQGNPAAPVSLAVSALGNWSPTITLSCSGPAIAAGASCAFSPGPTLTPGSNGTVSASLVILSGTAPQGQSTVTVTASAPLAPPKTVHVQAGVFNAQFVFRDVESGTTGLTTIHAGDTVEWDWVYDYDAYALHSTTSGTCIPGSPGTCTSSGVWDSDLYYAPHSYSLAFNNAGTFPYYCRDHGPLYDMVGTVNVAAGSTSKTQNVTLNIGAGTGSADLQVAITPSPATPNAAPVGTVVTFTVTVTNLSRTTPVPATANVIFTGPVTVSNALPQGCSLDPAANQAVKCNFNSANGIPDVFPIPVTVGFGRSVTAQVFVSSAAAETGPADNQAAATVQVRPRPFSRNGLPVIIP